MGCAKQRGLAAPLHLVFFRLDQSLLRLEGELEHRLLGVFAELHAERQAHFGQDYLHFLQALAPKVLGAEELFFGLLRQFPDPPDIAVEQAVGGADGEFQFVHRLDEVFDRHHDLHRRFSGRSCADSHRDIGHVVVRPERFGEADDILHPRRVAQPAQRLGLDLPDAFPRHLEVLPHLLDRVLLRADAEAQADDLLLARRERSEHRVDPLADVGRPDRHDVAPVQPHVAFHEVDEQIVVGSWSLDGAVLDSEEVLPPEIRPAVADEDLARPDAAAEHLHQQGVVPEFRRILGNLQSAHGQIETEDDIHHLVDAKPVDEVLEDQSVLATRGDLAEDLRVADEHVAVDLLRLLLLPAPLEADALEILHERGHGDADGVRDPLHGDPEEEQCLGEGETSVSGFLV